MAADPHPPTEESPLLHQFKNHLAIVVGFCDLLLHEIADADPKHADVAEMRKAAEAAMALLPELSRRLR
ncbi:MAG: hypothetical protein LAO77_02825 [Acidobacteriia bacterium]|nr:hypothetical protein [Terriglobia bacterium]